MKQKKLAPISSDISLVNFLSFTAEFYCQDIWEIDCLKCVLLCCWVQ